MYAGAFVWYGIPDADSLELQMYSRNWLAPYHQTRQDAESRTNKLQTQLALDARCRYELVRICNYCHSEVDLNGDSDVCATCKADEYVTLQWLSKANGLVDQFANIPLGIAVKRGESWKAMSLDHDFRIVKSPKPVSKKKMAVEGVV